MRKTRSRKNGQQKKNKWERQTDIREMFINDSTER